MVLRYSVEAVGNLLFKLKHFGILMVVIHGANIYCENQSVVDTTTLVGSKLNNKSSSAVYNYVRYVVAESIVIMYWIKTRDNLSVTFTHQLGKYFRK